MTPRFPRRPLVAANWKMHKLPREAAAFCLELASRLRSRRDDGGEDDASRGADVAVFPAHPLLAAVSDALVGSSLAWGGQDLHPEEWGAHTGEVSAHQLVALGCTLVLVGHSERRHDHGEDDELVGEKLARAAAAGLTPVLCVGETSDERRAGDTEAVLRRQLGAALEGAEPDDLVLAYEPVWAIGTGDTATPDTAQQAHHALREMLRSRLGETAADTTRILYGGSVKPHNAAELIAGGDVDGFLVGGASLDVAPFLAIIEAVETSLGEFSP